jgi:mRNA deadenylase 3'-5' endonuclease subunit Ccr4
MIFDLLIFVFLLFFLIKKLNITKLNNEIIEKSQFLIKKIPIFTENKYIEYIKNPKTKTFSILSYNILSQRYMKRKEIKSLELEKRIPKIIKEIKEEKVDLFCLQESTFEVYQKYLLNSFNEYNILTYDNAGSYLMNVIGVKKKRFEILSESKFDLSNNIIDITGNRGIINIKIKDKLFKDKIISLFNVHFPWKPIYEYQKARILNIIFEFILQNQNDIIIISGDFNSIPNSVPIRMIYYNDWINEFNDDKNYIGNFIFTKNEIDLIKEMRIKMRKRENFRNTMNNIFNNSKFVYEKYFLRSAYDEYKKGDNYEKKSNYDFLRFHPDYTNYTNNFINTIDYIIYSKYLNKVKILKIPLISKDYLPNEIYPSDHLKLYVEFEYTKK